MLTKRQINNAIMVTKGELFPARSDWVKATASYDISEPDPLRLTQKVIMKLVLSTTGVVPLSADGDILEYAYDKAIQDLHKYLYGDIVDKLTHIKYLMDMSSIEQARAELWELLGRLEQ